MEDPIAPIESLTLDLPPSCVEFCPAHPDYFCVGTYSLEADEARAQGDTSRPQNRSGSIVLFQLEDKKVRCVETLPQPSAVLDLHFQQVPARKDIFAVASSTATLAIFRLVPSAAPGRRTELLSVVRVEGVGDEVLFLSCAWHPSIPDLAAVSTSTGAVHVISLDPKQQPHVVYTTPILKHDLEAWTVVFSPPVSEGAGQGGSDNGVEAAVTLFSGGDDSFLRGVSCALEDSEGGCSRLALSRFGAGVTAILPVGLTDADGGQIVVTGSYDDCIRVHSIRVPVPGQGGGARLLAEKNLGGGVWRLKLMARTAHDGGSRWTLRVLASCMHAGARVLDIGGGGPSGGGCHMSVVARFEEHKSMNYASDCQPTSPALCVSTSFYDKLLCLWEAATG